MVDENCLANYYSISTKVMVHVYSTVKCNLIVKGILNIISRLDAIVHDAQPPKPNEVFGERFNTN